MNNKSRDRVYPLWLSLPGLLIYTLFFIVPIITAFAYSFTNWNLVDMNRANFVGLYNFISLLQDRIFLRSIGNTLLFAFFTTLFKTLVGLLLALLVARKFPGNSLFRTLYYLPCVLSTMIVGLLFTAILRQDGLLNNLLAGAGLADWGRDWLGSYGTAMTWIILVEIWMWAGFSMFIFISGLQAISRDYYESAQLDGATGWQQFRVYQLDLSNDKVVPFAFRGFAALQKSGFQQPPASEYRLVYEGEIICPMFLDEPSILQQIFQRCNVDFPEGYTGHSLSPSDVVELFEDGQRRYFYRDDFKFVPVNFSAALAGLKERHGSDCTNG